MILNYSVTSSYVDKDVKYSSDISTGELLIDSKSQQILDDKEPKKRVSVPGWLHIDPINTQLDVESVAYQVSNYKFTEGLNVTYEDLTNPKPLDYEPSPKFK